MKPQTLKQILCCLTLGGYTARVVEGGLETEGPQPLAGPLPASIKARSWELAAFLNEHCGGASLYEFGGEGQFGRAKEFIESLRYPCILCGEPEPAKPGIGCFVPNRDAVERFSGPMASLRQGKTRTLWYALCEECNDLEDAAGRVEARMEKDAERYEYHAGQAERLRRTMTELVEHHEAEARRLVEGEGVSDVGAD